MDETKQNRKRKTEEKGHTFAYDSPMSGGTSQIFQPSATSLAGSLVTTDQQSLKYLKSVSSHSMPDSVCLATAQD
jgi:hypothetical protein